MSIINDALKRAQKKLEQQGKKTDIKEVTKTEPSDKPAQQSKATASASAEKPVSMKRKKAWYKTISFLVPIFFMIAGIFIASIIFLMNRSSETSSSERNYRPKAKSNKPLPKGAIELNGISTIENRRVALINNEIYEEGDTIGQYIVISIQSSGVIIKDATGEIITLSVK